MRLQVKRSPQNKNTSLGNGAIPSTFSAASCSARSSAIWDFLMSFWTASLLFSWEAAPCFVDLNPNDTSLSLWNECLKALQSAGKAMQPLSLLLHRTAPSWNPTNSQNPSPGKYCIKEADTKLYLESVYDTKLENHVKNWLNVMTTWNWTKLRT